MASTIRRIVNTSTMHDQVQEIYKDVVQLKVKIQEREARLKLEKQKKILQKRCSLIIQNKIGLSKKYVYKRQNSFQDALAG